MGVWIETLKLRLEEYTSKVTPFVGVWIETPYCISSMPHLRVTPFVGVWIETANWLLTGQGDMSHPSWVCGLKHR